MHAKGTSRTTDPRSVVVRSVTLFQNTLSSTKSRLRPTARIPTVVCQSSCPIEICGVSTFCPRLVDCSDHRSPFANDSAVLSSNTSLTGIKMAGTRAHEKTAKSDCVETGMDHVRCELTGCRTCVLTKPRNGICVLTKPQT